MSSSNVELGFNRYGKQNVRFLRVDKSKARHEIKELRVKCLLEGEFSKSYLEADNSQILPTETQKNTMYAMAKKFPVEPIEKWAVLVARDLMQRHGHISAVNMKVEERPWTRMIIQGKEHNHAFQKGLSGERWCQVRVTRENEVEMKSGFHGMDVMKTAQSGFVGYIKDEYTTLGETKDRVMCTTVSGHYTFKGDSAAALQVDFSKVFHSVRNIVLEKFAGPPDTGRYSASVQQTLYDIGETALAKHSELGSIFFSLPNIHFYYVDFKQFRTPMTNDGEVFSTFDGAQGLIEATVVRKGFKTPPIRAAL